MAINVNVNGKWPGLTDNGGSFDFETKRDIDEVPTSIWPAEKGKEQDSFHLEDLRKHMFLLQNPLTGHYPETVGVGLINEDVLDGRAGYAAAVTADSDYPNQIAFAFGLQIVWEGRTWVCCGSSGDLDQWESPGGADLFGLNNAHVYSSEAAWDAHKPPENINPSVDIWNISNDYWMLVPDRNLYHDFDKFCPTVHARQDANNFATHLHIEHAKESLPENVEARLHLDGEGSNQAAGSQSKNRIPFGDVDEVDFERFLDQQKEVLRGFITQIQSLGTQYNVNWPYDIGGDTGTSYARYIGQAGGIFPEHSPLDPEVGGNNPDGQSRTEKKKSASYQNQLVRIIEEIGYSIYLPADNDYKKNIVEWDQYNALISVYPYGEDENGDPINRYCGGLYWPNYGTTASYIRVEHLIGGALSPDDGKWHRYRCTDRDGTWYYYPETIDMDKWELDDIVWDVSRHSSHNKYAKASDPWWGCNESAFECLLTYTGEYEWWFDIDHPHMPSHIQYLKKKLTGGYPSDNTNKHNENIGGEAAWLSNYTEQELFTMFPQAFGTYRKTFKGGMGRIDGRPKHRYDAVSTVTHDLTKTLMLPGSELLPVPMTAWKCLEGDGVYHWYGNFNDDPVRGAGEWPAGFAVREILPPWPCTWASGSRQELWYGHNWDMLAEGPGGLITRPTMLKYIDDTTGDTYDDYTYEPDEDGRLIFIYESYLLPEYNEVDHGALTPTEVTLVENFLELEFHHDPSQVSWKYEYIDDEWIWVDYQYFEIQAALLNEMRTILMNCRRRALPAELEVIHIEAHLMSDGRVQYETAEEVYDSAVTRLNALIPANPDDWVDDSNDHQPETEDVHVTTGQLANLMVGTHWSIGEWWVDQQINDDTYWGIGGYQNMQTSRCEMAKVAVRMKESGLGYSGSENTSEFFIQCLIENAFEVASKPFDPNVQTNFSLGIGDESWDMVQSEYFDPRAPWNAPDKSYQYSVQMTKMIQSLGAIESETGADWFVIESKPPYEWDDEQAIWYSFTEPPNTYLGNPFCSVSFSNAHTTSEGLRGPALSQFVGLYDWDLVLDSVWDTPNIKGIKQTTV